MRYDSHADLFENANCLEKDTRSHPSECVHPNKATQNLNHPGFRREFGCARTRLIGRIKRLFDSPPEVGCAPFSRQNDSAFLTISFRRRASAASRLAGLLASRLSALFLPRLRSSWIMVFFTYILSISRQEPPLEFSKPLRLFGSGGRPSIQAIPPSEPFVDLPFIVSGAAKLNYIKIIIMLRFTPKFAAELSKSTLRMHSGSLTHQTTPASNSRGFLCPGQPTTPRQVVRKQGIRFPVCSKIRAFLFHVSSVQYTVTR